MKQVNHLAIIAQPALVDGVTVNCPHCNEPAQLREDGSLYCVPDSMSFAPESTDGELFTMRRDFDARNGISLSDRLLMVPRMLVTSGFDPEGNGRFNPELSGALERFAMGAMLTGGLNRVYA